MPSAPGVLVGRGTAPAPTTTETVAEAETPVSTRIACTLMVAEPSATPLTAPLGETVTTWGSLLWYVTT